RLPHRGGRRGRLGPVRRGPRDPARRLAPAAKAPRLTHVLTDGTRGPHRGVTVRKLSVLTLVTLGLVARVAGAQVTTPPTAAPVTAPPAPPAPVPAPPPTAAPVSAPPAAPAPAPEAPPYETTVTATTPLHGSGLPVDHVPANVQTATSASI